MIVHPRPKSWQLLYILRGSIVPAVAPKVAVVAAFALAVCVLAKQSALLEHLNAGPLFSLLGLSLSIFLSFRNNACYERWWDGRKQWGALILETRSLARECRALLPDDGDAQRHVNHLMIGFAHALAARLRGNDMHAAAMPWLTAAQRERLAQRRNTPDHLLDMAARELAVPLHDGRLSPQLYAQMSTHLAAMSAIQAACERIASTPLPFAYTLLLHRCAWLFCLLLPFGLAGTLGWATPFAAAILAYAFFGLDQLGDEMEDPFGLEANDLPLNALVHIIELDLRDGLGEYPLPEPLLPRDGVLQ